MKCRMRVELRSTDMHNGQEKRVRIRGCAPWMSKDPLRGWSCCSVQCFRDVASSVSCVQEHAGTVAIAITGSRERSKVEHGGLD